MRHQAYRRSAKKELRQRIIHRDKRVCRYCGLLLVEDLDITLDHIVPFSRGGLTIPQNLVVSCKVCNKRKQDKFLWECEMDLIPLKIIKQQMF